MIGSSAANNDSFQVSTPSDEEIRMTRVFDAPRAIVYEAMTTPEHVRLWWGNLGPGYSVPVCEIDLRVGGKWKFVNRHANGEVTFYGEYLELDAPSRCVFTEIFADFPDSPSVVTSDLEDLNGRTRMVVTVRYPSRDVRDLVLSTGMEKGAAISYDRLNDLVVRLHQQR